jgi:hypothetical protein
MGLKNENRKTEQNDGEKKDRGRKVKEKLFVALWKREEGKKINSPVKTEIQKHVIENEKWKEKKNKKWNQCSVEPLICLSGEVQPFVWVIVVPFHLDEASRTIVDDLGCEPTSFTTGGLYKQLKSGRGCDASDVWRWR